MSSHIIKTSVVINPFQDKTYSFTKRPSPYRAVNTFHLGYKNLSVNVVEL